MIAFESVEVLYRAILKTKGMILMRKQSRLKIVSVMLAGVFLFSGCNTDSGEGKGKEASLHEPYYTSEPTAVTSNLCYSYVEFGTFPQTRLKQEEVNEAITNAKYDENGYCEVDGKSIKKLELDGVTNYYYVEPIRWRVVDVEGEEAVMVTESVIDVQPYHNEATNVIWKDSTLRQYLNEEFYQLAFNEKEQKKMIQSTVKNYHSKYSYPELEEEFCLEDTLDYVYIPASIDMTIFHLGDMYKEKESDVAHNVYTLEDEIYAKATDYTKDLNKALFAIEFPEETRGISWWTRTTMGETENIIYIDGEGTIQKDVEFDMFYYSCADAMGCRPVIRVKKDGLKVVE